MVCKGCGLEKACNQFYLSKNTKGGRRGKCIECTKKQNVQWYANNKEKLAPVRKQYQDQHKVETAARAKKWALENSERKREQSLNYYKNNRDKVLERSRQRHLDNPHFTVEKGQRRRTRLRKCVDTMPSNYMKILIDMYGDKCLRCGKNEVTLDHVIPLFLGGSHSLENAQLLCKSCNSTKGHLDMTDYRHALEAISNG